MSKAVVVEEKTCSTCRVVKLLTDFHRSLSAADGRQWNCKTCVQEYYRENPEGWWSSNYRRRALRAGLKPRDYGVYRQELVSRDGPGCAWCGDEDAPLELDHVEPVILGGAHAPWNTRLLCRPCHLSRRSSERLLRQMVGELADSEGNE